jgi:hypothetical protein
MKFAAKILGIVAIAVHGAEIVIGSGQGQTKKQLATSIIQSAFESFGELNLKTPEATSGLGPLIDGAVAFFNATGTLKGL